MALPLPLPLDPLTFASLALVKLGERVGLPLLPTSPLDLAAVELNAPKREVAPPPPPPPKLRGSSLSFFDLSASFFPEEGRIDSKAELELQLAACFVLANCRTFALGEVGVLVDVLGECLGEPAGSVLGEEELGFRDGIDVGIGGGFLIPDPEPDPPPPPPPPPSSVFSPPFSFLRGTTGGGGGGARTLVDGTHGAIPSRQGTARM
mmetsp:Transcript_27959/g.43347  ORF Transcript_27959/g.43347 Transcript_27959/m.43347 type:complete len:206 (-) Transcript_27959:35-652(-)